MAPIASVIVPTYGRPERLVQLVRSLLVQDIPPEQYEIVIVDDGSPQPADRSVRNVAVDTTVAIKSIRLSRSGPAAARALGVSQARGDLLVFVDDDMVIGTDFIREHIAAHHETDPAAVNCVFDWNVKARPQAFERWYLRRIEKWSAVRHAALRQIGEGLFEVPNILLTTANMSVRRVDYERVGGFDPGYRFSCEDQDFGLRLADAGVRGVVTSRTRATHVETHNTLRRVCQRQAAGARDTVRFMRRFSLLERPDQAFFVTINDPIKVGVDSWPLIIKKMLKTVVASNEVSPLVLATTAAWGRIPLWLFGLERVYDLVVSAHLRRGWCEGRRLYSADVMADRPGEQARVG